MGGLARFECSGCGYGCDAADGVQALMSGDRFTTRLCPGCREIVSVDAGKVIEIHRDHSPMLRARGGPVDRLRRFFGKRTRAGPPIFGPEKVEYVREYEACATCNPPERPCPQCGSMLERWREPRCPKCGATMQKTGALMVD